MDPLEREYGITLDRAGHEAWATAATFLALFPRKPAPGKVGNTHTVVVS